MLWKEVEGDIDFPKVKKVYVQKSILKQRAQSKRVLEVYQAFYKPLVNRCDASFILGEALTYHKKSDHSEDIKALKCEYCPREFFTKATKSVHEKLHFEAPKSQLYFCNLCLDGVTFSVSELIGHHQSFHEGLPLPYFQVCVKSRGS